VVHVVTRALSCLTLLQLEYPPGHSIFKPLNDQVGIKISVRDL